MKRDVSVAIIGAGLSGITLGIELKKRLGLNSFTIYERAQDVGGTWRDNFYPGCACDVPSHWYSLSSELNPDWSQKYSSQPEIQAYWKRIYEKHRLVEHTKFDHTFVSAIWVEDDQAYDILFKNSKGDQWHVKADVLVSCIGGFSTPLDKPHGMKGLDDFKGERFHSARWNYDVSLKNKRVGVIGNGCSATQFVPIISEDKSTHVLNFSRTASWFMPRDQYSYPNVVKAMFRYVPGLLKAYRFMLATASDGRYIVWPLRMSPIRHYIEEVSAAYIRSQAPAKYHNFLIPKYPFGCKRIIMDPGYLKSLNRSNVELVTDPIDTITANGIRGKSGKEYAFDVLILATGFDVSEVGLGINVTGRDGSTVTEQWKSQKGPQAYLGTTISNYPNFFSILGPNVASGITSVVYSTEAQVNYIVKMIEPMVKYGVTSLECKPDAEKRYNDWLHARLNKTVWAGGCKSYYKLGDKVIATYPGPITELKYYLSSPKWEDYLQIGGTRRLAVRHRLSQAFKGSFLLVFLIALRRMGWKRLRMEIIMFLLSRYQDVLGVAERLRIKSA